VNPAAFEYHRPATLDEAIGLLGHYGEDARPLAGGQSLLPILKLRLLEPVALIDLSRIPALSGVQQRGEELVMGAMTTHYSVLSSPVVQRFAPLLAEAAAVIGDPQVRNRGTLGGALAHADPGADMEAAVLAAGARISITGPSGTRVIPAEELFVDLMTTSLKPGELLTDIAVPVLRPGQGGAYEKFPNPASRFALVGVAAQVTLEGDRITDARSALTGAAPTPQRLPAVEAALIGKAVDAIDGAAAEAATGWEANDDLHASADYRRHLARVLTARALKRAVAVARGEAKAHFGVM
jgi:carbon-monoxide dehydrogenase medium subunit